MVSPQIDYIFAGLKILSVRMRKKALLLAANRREWGAEGNAVARMGLRANRGSAIIKMKSRRPERMAFGDEQPGAEPIPWGMKG